MEKRLLTAVALSIFIIIAFQYLGPKPVRPPQPIKAPGVIATTPSASQETAISAPSPSNPAVEEKETIAETDKYILTFSNMGGSIKKIQLKDHKNLSDNGPLELAGIKNPKEYIGAISTNLSKTPLDVSEYAVTKKGDEVICELKAKDLTIIKRYILHNTKHYIELQISAKNTSAAARKFSYDIIGGSHLKETDTQASRFNEVMAKMDGKTSKVKLPKTGRVINLGLVEWVALKDKYFSLILKPVPSAKSQFIEESESKEIITGVGTNGVTLEPGASTDEQFILYAGPSQIANLKEAGYGLEESVDYGFFGPITKVLLVAMHAIYAVVHSWGVSIILLSIVLNIVLFPLTIKSFKSMQKMQELHPQMEKLKKEHKDNPQKLNKEIMELYKKYKINPLSGCLPMLLQMPVFFALYQALMKSIELRGTKFLWISDLSSPDAIRLPFTLPMLGNKLHLLPLIMVGAMLVQQKISTKTMGAAVTDEQKQQQKMMLIMMPVMFGLIFYNMPSGLVLYWIVNTVLTVIEQSAVLKKD